MAQIDNGNLDTSAQAPRRRRPSPLRPLLEVAVAALLAVALGGAAAAFMDLPSSAPAAERGEAALDSAG